MAAPADKVIFFDGYCGFCSSAVDWVMPRDREGIFRFAPIQGATARARLPLEIVERATPDSIIYVRGSETFERSTAILEIIKDLDGAYSVAGALLMVPQPIRDFFYDLFARHRYRLFGKRESCRLPTPAERGRILD